MLGFLDRATQPKGYRLGLRCLELGRHVTKTLPILEISQPFLRELCRATRETVNLAVPYLHEGIIVEALQSQQAVRATAYCGTRAPTTIRAPAARRCWPTSPRNSASGSTSPPASSA